MTDGPGAVRVVALVVAVVAVIALLRWVDDEAAPSGGLRWASDIPLVELAIPEDAIRRLETALERGDPRLRHERGGDRPFVNASIREAGRMRDCEVAILAPPTHHDPAKPSLRVKFRKRDARDGVRRIDLYRPDDPLALDGVMYSQLGAELGLLSDSQSLVRLAINGEFRGVYRAALPTGLAMTQACARFAGTFLFSDPGSDRWRDVSAWRRFGRDDIGGAPLRPLLAAVAAREPKALEGLLDVNAFARWSALRLALGRVERSESQVCLFFAPEHGRFEPVVWPFDGETVTDWSGDLSGGSELLEALENVPGWSRRLADAWGELESRLTDDDLRGRIVDAVAASASALARDVDPVPEGEAMVRAAARLASFRDRMPPGAAFDSASSGAAETIVLGPGVVPIDTPLRVTTQQELRVVAGTTLEFATDCGLFARGVVRIEGTAERPVVIRGKGKNGRFDGFAIVGSQTRGSSIRHCDFEGGRATTVGHHRLAAAIVVHACPDVAIESSRFGPAGPKDDTLHVSGSQFRIRECVFEDARKDAIDVAFGAGVLESVTVRGARRHGIDVSAAEVTLRRVRVDGAKRAGVSVGEGARVLLEACEVRGCADGLDSRDGARVLVRGGSLTGNATTVRCAFEEWRHVDGGAVALDDSDFEPRFEIGDRSELVIADARRGVVGDWPRVVFVPRIPADWLRGTPR